MADLLPTEAGLFDRYRPLHAVPDELVDSAGYLRPAWKGLIAHLESLSQDEIEAAIAQGDQFLSDSGVFARQMGHKTAETREYPFSAIPVVLPEAEWREIEAGLIQRAELMEKIAADLYGDNTLVANGHLPAKLIAQSPEYLLPMVGLRPQGGNFLHFIGFEIGRGPDGRWWVMSDRTDAPSGAGFALENRVATSRVFHEVFRDANVIRLASFFRAFRNQLDSLRGGNGSQVSMLTPGPMSETYSEQAYIARYLGLPLLEGDDLIVENGQLLVRTVDGLTPVDVLWRRMDGIWADPLELRQDSHLGTPGLLSALRAGKVTMVNALGVGVLETQALMAFMPSLSKVLLGTPLKMPNVATWWCGQPKELAHVRVNAKQMMIGPALSTRMPFETGAPYAIAGEMREGNGKTFDAWLTENAEHLVAKELVKLSTTPVYVEGRLEPRPMSLRVFLARTARGWQVMPGGFARIGANADSSAISMRSGGTVADVWIAADRPVEQDSLVAQGDAPFVRAVPGALPAQAADNMFWLGRYVERTEGLIRLLRAYNSRLDAAAAEPLLASIRALLNTFGVDATEPVPYGLLATLSAAVSAGGQIRDRLNVDAWAALMDMEKSMTRIARTTYAGIDATSVMSVMLRKLSGFAGLVHENMYRTTGWQFMTLGRSIERASMTAELLIHAADPACPEGGLDLAIEVGDSMIIHRQRYSSFARRETVIDLLALDGTNPRALRFHVDIIAAQGADLCRNRVNPMAHEFEAKIAMLHANLVGHTVATLDTAALQATRSAIFDISVALNAAFIK